MSEESKKAKAYKYTDYTCSLLGLLFIHHKLSGTIDWSWWWVTMPFYAGFVAIGAFLGICALLAKFADRYCS